MYTNCFDWLLTTLPPVATPPQRPPPFTAPFQGIMRLVHCPVVHRALLCVLKQAATQDSKLWSDKLIHEALHLLGIMMLEEDPAHPGSLRNIALGRGGGGGGSSSNHSLLPRFFRRNSAPLDNALLGHLEALKANRRAEEYLPLLDWILQYLHTPMGDEPPPVAMDTTDSEPVEVMPPAPSLSDPSVDEEALRKRKAMAAAKRNVLMTQMAQMQKSFLRKHDAELASISTGGTR